MENNNEDNQMKYTDEETPIPLQEREKMDNTEKKNTKASLILFNRNLNRKFEEVGEYEGDIV